MKGVNLVYWHLSKSNYGDLLSYYIVSELSAENVYSKTLCQPNVKNRIKEFVKCVVKCKPLHYLFSFEDNVLAIGSILAFSNKYSKIWGTGFWFPNQQFQGGTVYAVRGKYTLAELVKQNTQIDDHVVLGDPGLLVSLLLQKQTEKYSIGFVPHIQHFGYFAKRYGACYKVIDLNNRDVEFVTKEISSCKYILSTSLHGLIVAHAYGIPALWVHLSDDVNVGNGFKYKDYFSSVGIDNYDPIDASKIDFTEQEIVLELFSRYKAFTLPQKDIRSIQQKLLACAPFVLKEKYNMK